MSTWKSLLKADPTAWLLEEDKPSVRYLTLVDIRDKPAAARDANDLSACAAARNDIHRA